MATLTSTKIKNTYDALLKATDNDAIGSVAKQITDGLGNGTPLYISTTQIGIGVTPEATYDLHVYSNAKVGGNLTVTGDLTVDGTVTTVSSETLTVTDPLIELAKDNTSTDALDIGFYGKYAPSGTTLYAGLFRDTGDSKFKLFRNLEEQPTTTVNTSGTGYTVATLVADLEGTLTGTIASSTVATTQSTGDNSTKVATTAYVDASIGNSTLAEVLVNGNTTSGTDISVSASDDITFTNTSKAIFGGSLDLQVYSDGSNNYIDSTSNELRIRSNDLRLLNYGTAKYITADNGADVSLYYNNSKKLETTTTGVTVTGAVSATTFSGQLDGTISSTTTATTQTQGDNSTKVATTAYVDSAIGGQDTLAEILANGNTTGGTDISVSSGDDITLAAGSKVQYSTNSFMTPENNVTGAEISTAGDFRVKTGTTPSLALILGGTQDVTFYGNITINGNNKHIRFIDTYGNWDIEVGDGANNFKIHSGSLNADYLTLEGGGQLNLGEYGSGSFTGTATYRLAVDSSGDVIEIPIGDGAVDGSGAAGQVAFWTDTDTIDGENNLYWDSTNDRLGIGTNSPLTALEVIGTDPNNNVSRVVNVKDDRSYAANVGGGISLFGKYNSGGSYSTFAQIIGAKTNATDGDYSGYLSFKTRPNNSLPTEKMRIESNGKIDISGYGTEGAYVSTKGSFRIDIDNDNDHTDRAFIVSSNNAGSDLLTIGETGNSTFAGEILVPSGDFISWGTSGHSAIEGSTVSNSLKLRTNNTVALTLDSSQNATFAGKIIASDGVQFTGGTIATSTAVLHTNNILYLRGGSNGLFLQNADGSDGIYVANDHIRFDTSSTERMRIDSNGKAIFKGDVDIEGGLLTVGQGNNGENRIEIGKDRTTNGFAYIDLVGDTTYTDYGFRIIRGSQGANAETILTHRGTGIFNINTDDVADMSFSTDSAERMRIKSDGQIKTQNRSFAKESNYGYSSTYKALVLGSTGTNTATDSTTVSINYDPSGNAYSGFSGDGREVLFRRGVQFVTPNSADNSMYLYNLVLKDGHVGIGVQSPDNTLDIDSNYTNTVQIQGTGSHSLYSYHDSGGVGWATGSGANYDNLIYIEPTDNIKLYTSGSLRFVVNNNGDVYNYQSVNRASTYYGYGAGDYSATGASNNAFGYNALASVTTGNENVAIGRSALGNLTTGVHNVAIGHSAGLDITTANNSTLIGFAAGTNITTGSGNIYIGYAAGEGTTTGTGNTGVGYAALNQVTTGLQNTAVGQNSGDAITTGNYNSLFGLNSGTALTTGGYNTVLGFAALESQTTQSYTTAVGTYALNSNVNGQHNTAVGYQALYANTGSYNTGFGFQALRNNTTGSENHAIGRYSLYGNTTGIRNTASGNSVLENNTTGSNNAGFGYAALYNATTASGNTAIGYLAQQYATTGGNNTTLGNSAGRNITTGSENTMIGMQAGHNTTTGRFNTFVGRVAGYQNTTSDSNTAIGWGAGYALGGGTRNTALGRSAMENGSGVTGNDNTAVGHNSLNVLTSGASNTCVGAYSGDAITSGAYNTFMGQNAGGKLTSGNYNTAIGRIAMNDATTAGTCTAVGYGSQQRVTSASNNTSIGYISMNNATTASNNVGLGHESLRYLTTGNDNVAAGLAAMEDATTGSGNIAIGRQALQNLTTGGSNIAIGYAASGGANMTGTGYNVVIGDAAGYNLTSGHNNILIGHNAGRTGLQGTDQSMGGVTTGDDQIHIGNESHTNALVQVSWTVNSDGRDKTDVKDLDLGLDFIDSLRPVTYRWDKRSRYNGGERTGEHKEKQLEVGLIAQEVIEQENKAGYNFEENTNLFSWESEDKNKVGLQYEKLVPALINAIKELKQEIEILKSK